MSKKNKHKKKKYSFKSYEAYSLKPCHEATEIIPNLFLCKEPQIKELVKSKKIDVLVPLADLDGSIWETGFKGEILYYPVEDFGVLPQHILKRCVNNIIGRLKKHKVAVFCMGGHGRTGYIAACILGKLGYEDPIKTVRNKYCKSAIECNEQVESIATFLEKPKLAETYHIQPTTTFSRWGSYYNSPYSCYNYGSAFTDIPVSNSGDLKTKSGISESMVKHLYEEDCLYSQIEYDAWEDLDLDNRQALYDYYTKNFY